jgi:regulatory protein
VAELARRLAAKGCDAALASAVASEVASAGLADDRRFAEAYVRSRVERGYGPLRVAGELRLRGVAEDLARQALAGYAGEWLERMERARSKRFGAAPRSRQARLRQARFLEYRGFPRDLIGAWLETAAPG